MKTREELEQITNERWQKLEGKIAPIEALRFDLLLEIACQLADINGALREVQGQKERIPFTRLEDGMANGAF